jgi:hypothetical protein
MRTHYAMTRGHLQVVKGKSLSLAFCPAIRSIVFFPFLLLLLNVSLFSQDVSVFQPSAGPTNPKFNDGLPIEAGMKFRSSQDGYIKGIRYYKVAGTTGVHTAHLWNSTGSKLAEATFVNETASGWQQVLFGSPVAITANTTYVASYHSASGDYAATNPYFTQAVTNSPLRALANGEDGPNGVYTYTTSFAFPNNASQSANYWVDVIFNTVNAPDVTPPTVSFVSPLGGEANVNYNRNVSATFNEAIDPGSVTSSTFELRDPSNNAVPGSFMIAGNEITLDPVGALAHATIYTATIKGGPQGVKDLAGNALANDYSWSFTIADLPAPEGSGGPILVLSSISNPFSRYAIEILRAQGLNEFLAKDILQTTASELTSYDVIVLGEMSISSSQAAMLTAWVNAGGTLISFRPAPELSPLLGITKFTGSLSDGYLLIDTSSLYGKGIVGETIQFHSTADFYTLNGASPLATLYSNAATGAGYPAITVRNVGNNGGRAFAFTYDLSRSIVYTRQGNPMWAGQKRDGTAGPIRSDDMFFGINSPHWVDFNKIAIPQADEQQHLLTNIILQSNLHRKPLPKFWFLPSGHKAAIVMTGDDHSFNGTTGQFNHFKTLGPNTPDDVANWKAIRATSYIYNGTMTNPQAAGFAAEGFEIALHINTNCQNFTPFSLQDNFSQQLTAFNNQLPNVPPSITNRNHCVAWSDWATAAKIQSQFGVRLDVNYYYWPASWVQNRPGLFTGSGMPMRFADLDGSLIDCYQVTTQMTDEAQIDYGPFSAALLNKALGAEGYYGVFCANMHTDTSFHAGANSIIAEAIARNVPVVSARQMLKWLDGRNGSSFGSFNWNNNQLAFTITALPDALNLQGMLPFYADNGQLVSLTRDGSAVPFTKQNIKGIEYAFFNVPVGTASWLATYSSPATAPLVTLHPVPQEVCVGSTVIFTSTASGSPSPTVQWEMSYNGVDWTAIPGATNDTLSFTATIDNNNKKLYRAVWTNADGSAISDSALLIVNPLPELTSGLSAFVVSGQSFDYTPVSSEPTTSFSWVRHQVAGVSNPPASGNDAIHEILLNTTSAPVYVKYIYTLVAKGCSNTQNVIVTVKPGLQEESCTVTSCIVSNFNSNSIKAGRYIWFNSVVDPSGLNSAVTFKLTNSRITFNANNVNYTLDVPDATVQFSNVVQTPTTQFSQGAWKTLVPLKTSGNVFLTGLAYPVPVNLPGGIKNVRWTVDISTDQPGVAANWKWAAAVYTNFATNAGLSIKPVDGPLQLINTNLTDKAGTPLNYKLYVVPGATGGGLLGGLLSIGILNYTGDYSSAATLSCTAAIVQGARSAYSEDYKKAIIQPTGESAFNVKAMPNPSNSHFRLQLSGSNTNPVTVRIFDVSGRVVEQFQKSANSTIEVGAHWKGGTYMAELVQDGQRKIVKLVKVN